MLPLLFTFVLLSASHVMTQVVPRDCPSPFPPMLGDSNGICSCYDRGHGLLYNCRRIKEFHRVVDPSVLPMIAMTVQYASIASCRLTRNFLASYAPQMTEFECRSCGLTDIEPFAFSDVTSLQSVILDSNNLAVITALAFANLFNVRYLSLRQCGITSIEPDAFLNLSGMKYLFIADNDKMVVQPGAFHNVSIIRQLDMSEHGMSYLNGSRLAGLSHIEHLILSARNGLHELGPGAFAGTYNISKISITNSHLRAVRPGTFAGGRHVGEVRLISNEVTTVERGSLDGDVLSIDWRGNPIECDERLSWLFNQGGVGDGFNEMLLKDMQCAAPAHLRERQVSTLTDAYSRATVPASGTTSVLSSPMTSSTADPMVSLLHEYVEHMKKAGRWQRKKNGALRRVASSAVIFAALATLAAMQFSLLF